MKLLFILLPLFLTACVTLGGGNRGYDRNSPEGIECTYEAKKGAASVQATGRSGLNFDQMYKEEELFNLCMASKRANNPKPSSNSAVDDGVKKFQERVKSQCLSIEFKEYYAKTGCLPADITFEQLADTSKITPSQKVVMLKARSMADSANKEVLMIYKNSGQSIFQKYANLIEFTVMPQNDSNNLDLYNGKITWGEYNQKRKEIDANARNLTKELR